MKRLFAIAVLLAGAAAPAVTQAQDYGRPVFGAGRGDQDQAREGVRSGRQAPLSRVLAMIGARYPGRHLNTTMGDAGGRPAYFVQWQLENGRVVVFMVDAESGQIVGRQGG
ncbi:PepSY domain-containing protein [Phenylobacterium sp.]|uniref:PepSY domain-containing protein n=1 Tax=Phenylobacterium sp. TaxID=1871053 RepID=UPI00391D44FB